MKRLAIAVLVTLLALPAFAADVPKTDAEKTLYAVGVIVAGQLAPFSLNPAELEMVKQGITDAATGKKPLVEADAYQQQIQALVTVRRKAQGDKMAAEAKGFVEKAAKEKGAVKTASGLIYNSQKEGSGASPTATDMVKVHYSGALVNGVVFDSSYKRGQPAEFPLNGVIKCWTEGMQMMKPGGKARLICPPEIAYGERGAGNLIPPQATLVFDVELLEVKPGGKLEIKPSGKHEMKPGAKK
ncbi:MAG: FKBP-type peptidyl-prolyl cis-trans isomerase [Syntrophales bacterium]